MLSPKVGWVNLSQMLPDLAEVPESMVDEAIWDTFQSWASGRGISLYPAQEEASLGILAGDNVILATPCLLYTSPSPRD